MPAVFAAVLQWVNLDLVYWLSPEGSQVGIQEEHVSKEPWNETQLDMMTYLSQSKRLMITNEMTPDEWLGGQIPMMGLKLVT